MSSRAPRRIVRAPYSYRDDRKFIIACDDTFAPKQYFDRFRLTRVTIRVVPAVEGRSAALAVLDRLLAEKAEAGDERWMLLDTDHFTQGTHLKGFLEALAGARINGVHVALSRPCFELWLLLHCMNEPQVVDLQDAKVCEAALREHLGEYNKTNLKRSIIRLQP